MNRILVALALVAASAGTAGAQVSSQPPDVSGPPIVSPFAATPTTPWISVDDEARGSRSFLLTVDSGLAVSGFDADRHNHAFDTTTASLMLGVEFLHPRGPKSLSMSLGYDLQLGFDATGLIHRHVVTLELLGAGWLLSRVGIGPVFVNSREANVHGGTLTCAFGVVPFHRGLYALVPLSLDSISDLVIATAGVSIGYRTL